MPRHDVPPISAEERELGLDTDITRRDFLNASLFGAGALLLAANSPAASLRAAIPTGGAFTGFAGVGDYARSNGNTAEVIDTAHAFRDGRFRDAARRAVDTGETFDLVVVGGGLSGLAAAYRFRQLRGGSGRCLILDNHPLPGGEAKRNEFDVDGTRIIGPQGSNGFFLDPPKDWLGQTWHDLGLPVGSEYGFSPWTSARPRLETPREHYYWMLWSDEFHAHGYFYPQSGGLGLTRDPFRGGLKDLPWSAALKDDFLRWRTETKRYRESPGVGRWLDTMTYENYVTKVMGLDPAVARYVDPICASAIGLGSDVTSAYAAAQIGLPGLHTWPGPGGSRRLADNMNAASFPGGNDGIARHFLKALVPKAVRGGRNFNDVMNGRMNFAALDTAGSATRIRVSSTVVHVANGAARGPAEVVYARGGRIERVRARAVVMANGGWAAQHAVADLPGEYRDAYREFVRAPMLVVNIAVRNWRFMHDLGITAASYRDEFGMSVNVREPIMAGNYRPPFDPDKPSVLTMYVPFSAPAKGGVREQASAGRTELLGTSYREYERRIRRQLVRLFERGGFDARRDIAGIVLNRWGHAYVCPTPGFYFGRNGKPASRDVIRKPLGAIAFANAELNGHQEWAAAVTEGKRAAELVAG